MRTLLRLRQPGPDRRPAIQTVVPTQSLFLINNDLFRKRAKALADHLVAEFPQADVRLEQLWLRVFNRPITATER